MRIISVTVTNMKCCFCGMKGSKTPMCQGCQVVQLEERKKAEVQKIDALNKEMMRLKFRVNDAWCRYEHVKSQLAHLARVGETGQENTG